MKRAAPQVGVRNSDDGLAARGGAQRSMTHLGKTFQPGDSNTPNRRYGGTSGPTNGFKSFGFESSAARLSERRGEDQPIIHAGN
jgi:hypothetical protein